VPYSEDSTEKQQKLLKKLDEFETYIRNNAGLIPNYGERWRYGETNTTAFVESTINQVVSKRMVKKAADALEPARRSFAVADPHPRSQ
jgi:hypothetical protein